MIDAIAQYFADFTWVKAIDMAGLVLGLIYLWFLLSFKWSIEDMSTLEKCVGIVYGFVMVPVYYKLTDVMKLR